MPKLSQPLTKAIRTSEGILVWVINIVIGVAALLGKIDPQDAALFATINTGAHTASRTLLKGVALQKQIGVGDPIQFDPAALGQAGEYVDQLAEALPSPGAGEPVDGVIPDSAMTPDGAPGDAPVAAAVPPAATAAPPAATPPLS